MSQRRFKTDVIFESLTVGGGGNALQIAPDGTLQVSSATPTDLDLLALAGGANGLATLDGSGLIPSSQLPAIAVTSVSQVADQRARDALTGQQEGDVAIVSNAAGLAEEFDIAITSVSAGDYIVLFDGQGGVGDVEVWFSVDASPATPPNNSLSRAIEVSLTAAQAADAGLIGDQLAAALAADTGYFGTNAFNVNANDNAGNLSIATNFDAAVNDVDDSQAAGITATITAQGYDAAVTSGSASFIFTGTEGVDGAWVLFKSGDEVLSVNGQTGNTLIGPEELNGISVNDNSNGSVLRATGGGSYEIQKLSLIDIVNVDSNSGGSSSDALVFNTVSGAWEARQLNSTDISYDNTASGLTATDAKGAIDEVEGRVDSLESQNLIYGSQGSIALSTDNVFEDTSISLAASYRAAKILISVNTPTTGHESFELHAMDTSGGSGTGWQASIVSVGNNSSVSFQMGTDGIVEIASSDVTNDNAIDINWSIVTAAR